MSEPPLSPSARRVQDALVAAGLPCRVVEHASPARTSAEAAALLGCEVAQIAKSLVFRRGAGGPPGGAVLVIASGANRVDEAKVAALLREPVGRADAAFVRAATGYAIGGIPPIAHATSMPVLVDRDLVGYDIVYAAGGTPHALFPIAPADLVRASGGTVADIALAG
ncbi:Cys-tRNA(Pro)/Cys-tRNA(Cys) deacylase YbaK [Burkholderiales bacterium]|nr:Cys-tRNA(Pro)/Cys-tRNA(Cys) deacylase YbaK [Burkholderiales bacterium]